MPNENLNRKLQSRTENTPPPTPVQIKNRINGNGFTSESSTNYNLPINEDVLETKLRKYCDNENNHDELSLFEIYSFLKPKDFRKNGTIKWGKVKKRIRRKKQG